MQNFSLFLLYVLGARSLPPPFAFLLHFPFDDASEVNSSFMSYSFRASFGAMALLILSSFLLLFIKLLFWSQLVMHNPLLQLWFESLMRNTTG